MLARILLVIVDGELRTRLHGLLAGPDAVITELPADDWLDLVPRDDCDLVIADSASLPDDPRPVDAIRQRSGRAELIVVDDGDDPEETAHLLASGCLAVIPTSLSDAMTAETLTALTAKMRERSLAVREALEPPAADGFGDFLSSSSHMQTFLKVARKLSQSESTVLILGETGVGKERLARAIHGRSSRGHEPFVVLNCGAVPESLLESELFGHEKGAFTGAVRSHRGHFEIAHRGTIFLDEIGEMPLHLQVKLLRVIQERTIQRIGGEQPIKVDVRVMAATNRDLLTEMEEKRFRPDLYYRLSVVSLEVPPLRERRDDIPALVSTYFDQFRTQMSTSAQSFSDAAMRALETYSWPGNIRELINVVERAVLLADGARIELDDLPMMIANAVEPTASGAAPSVNGTGELDASWLRRPLAEARQLWIAGLERAYLVGLLRATGGRIGETASRAGIDPRSLYTKMRLHGLRKEDYR